jgi:predicted nuclease of predicted toxin-antitoxin system
MRIKLDENLSRHLKLPPEQRGHAVTTAAEEGLLGKSDLEVGATAKAEGRMLFTLDLEFADLRKYPPGGHPGVVLFRPRSMGPLAVSSFVLAFARETELSDLAGCVAIVEWNRVRVRRPPPDADLSEWKEYPPRRG